MPPTNQHPAVMFEIIAKDQASMKAFYTQVFGWNYSISPENGFAYVQFPMQPVMLLGGIGQAQTGTPGFEPGHNFYLRVANMEETIERAVAAGGKHLLEPTKADQYCFAMIEDPEGNPVGLIQQA
jgi:predicted enzyme related to lactoylglutathione lyase